MTIKKHINPAYRIFAIIVVTLLSVKAVEAQFQIKDNKVMEQANLILQKMTLDEKLQFISGGPKATINGIPRLGLRPIRMSDGPLGVKGEAEGEIEEKIAATAFPSAITMASTWNNNLLYSIGEAIGKEAKYNGIDILLGPSVNMVRIPQNGRNFEYFGEDPYLASKLGVQYIKGIQSKGILADVKHFAANNTEFNRYKSNSVIDKRTLHEIYLPAFEAAVNEAGCATVMTAHNLLNGTHCSEDSYLLDTVLRKNWGFNGFVISDWFSNYELVPTIKHGVDIEMPIPRILAEEKLKSAMATASITETDIDNKVRRLLYTCLYFKLYEPQENAKQKPDLDAHAKIALQTAEEGTVLLKNQDNFLPLSRKNIRKIVLVGDNVLETPLYGGGAAGMKATRQQSMLLDIKHTAGNNLEVVYLDDIRTEGQKKRLKEADVIIIGMGFNSKTEGEAHDRPFNLPSEQISLLQSVSAINANTIAVIYAGGSVNILPWLSNVKALLMGWYMGDATGHVIGKILFGDINPSGKLPVSIEKKWEDSPAFPYYDKYASEAGVPALFKPFYEKINGAVNAKDKIDTEYGEGVFMGYRHFTSKGIEPLFPFGHGLSYTQFTFSGLKIEVKNKLVNVSVAVKNIGKTAGAEVVQLYVGDDKASVERPVKELKRFEKVFLESGKSKTIQFTLLEKDLSFWDITTNSWKAEPGTFILYAANSSADNSLSAKFLWK